MKIDKSKLDKSLEHIESALVKIKDGRWLMLSEEEYDVVKIALEIAAGICTEAKLFKERV